MDDLYQKMREMEEIMPSPVLHQKIQKRILFGRFNAKLKGIIIIAILGLTISVWRFWVRISDNQAIDFISFMLREFEFNGLFFRQFLTVLQDVIPTYSTLILLANLILVLYVTKFSITFKRMTFNNGRPSS